MSTGSITDIRRKNRDTVMREIACCAPVSRSHIAKQCGLTGAAISRITRELIDAGLITEGKTIKVKGQVGRRNIRLALAKNGAYVLGITLTANFQSVSIGNIEGKTIDHRRIDQLDFNDPEDVVEKISLAAHVLILSTKIDATRLVGCGIAIGGVVDSDSGVLIRSDPLQWKNIPLAAMFEKKLKLPVKLEGRAVALLLAEQKGGSRISKKNVVLISNGLWVGGAMMLEGRVVKGHSNMIGQIGHFSINGNQTPCSCGRQGCLDAVASGNAIIQQLKHIKLDENEKYLDRLRLLSEYTGTHAQEVNAIFMQAGKKMGYAVDAIISILDPEQIVLTGATQRQQHYIKGINETLAKIRANQENWPVKVSRVTSEQSAIWLGLSAFVFSPLLNIEQLKKA